MKILLAGFLLAIGCASPEYQKMGANGVHRTGYEDQKLGSTMYRIRYLDKDSQSAYKNFLRRASQITLENGFTHFRIKDTGPQKEGAIMVALSPGVASDWALPQYEATIILLKSSEPDSFDAKDILETNPIPKGRTASK